MLYHKDLGLPKGFNGNVGTVRLDYSMHAKQAALNDKYGRIKEFNVLDTSNAQVIEVELVNGQVNKIVYRTEYTKTLDLVIVVMPRGHYFFVKSQWLNLASDDHKTLDVSKYNRVS